MDSIRTAASAGPPSSRWSPTTRATTTGGTTPTGPTSTSPARP